MRALDLHLKLQSEVDQAEATNVPYMQPKILSAVRRVSTSLSSNAAGFGGEIVNMNEGSNTYTTTFWEAHTAGPLSIKHAGCTRESG